MIERRVGATLVECTFALETLGRISLSATRYAMLFIPA